MLHLVTMAAESLTICYCIDVEIAGGTLTHADDMSMVIMAAGSLTICYCIDVITDGCMSPLLFVLVTTAAGPLTICYCIGVETAGGT